MKKNVLLTFILLFLLLLSAEMDLFSFKIGRLTQNFSTAELSFLIFDFFAVLFIRKNNFRNFLEHYKPLIFLSLLFLLSGLLSSIFSPVDKIYAIKNLVRYFLFTTSSLLFIYLTFVERAVKDYFYFSLFIIAILLSLVSIVESFNQSFAGLLADIFRGGNSVYINNRLRPSATLTHSNIFSCFMAISVFVALKMYFENKISKITFICGIILFLTGLSFGSSRNALWTFLIALLVFALNKKHLKIAALIFLTFLITYFAFTPSLKRMAEIKTESSVSRILLWKSSVKMFKDYPILGVGPGCFNKSIIKYAPEDLLRIENQFINKSALNAHNGFFNALAEFGLSGIIILTIFLFYYLSFFVKLHPFPSDTLSYSVLFVISLPFLADAFFYSYFYMTVFCIILFLLLQKTDNSRFVVRH